MQLDTNGRVKIRRVILNSATLTVLGLLLLSALAFYQGVPVFAQSSPNFVAQAVTGPINLNAPGGETFWAQINGVQVPLTSTNNYGGNVKSILVKFATNGTHILVFASWTDPTESRTKNSVIESDSYPGLFKANATFAYEDRIVFWWSLDQNPGSPPCMQKSPAGHGEGEALAGTGNLWHWKAARTDSLGTSYGKLKYGSGPFLGQPIAPAHSYSDNEFINVSGHYQLGFDQYPNSFSIGYDPNKIPYNTFVVSAHGVYNPASHTWSWVAARPLTITPGLHDIQFRANQNYYFSVGIWDGGPIPIPSTTTAPAGWTSFGENEETKSISTWYTMQLGAPTPTTVTTTALVTTGSQAAQGAPLATTALVSLGTLVVGLLIGMVAIRRFTKPK
jgi:hypothetical protein